MSYQSWDFVAMRKHLITSVCVCHSMNYFMYFDIDLCIVEVLGGSNGRIRVDHG